MMRTPQAISHLDGVSHYPTPEQAAVLGVLGLRNPPTSDASVEKYFVSFCKRVLNLPPAGAAYVLSTIFGDDDAIYVSHMLQAFTPDEVQP